MCVGVQFEELPVLASHTGYQAGAELLGDAIYDRRCGHALVYRASALRPCAFRTRSVWLARVSFTWLMPTVYDNRKDIRKKVRATA